MLIMGRKGSCNKSKIKITIVVPVYNVEDYIKECLDSLIEQTYDNIEIILVDDGSTDSSGIICDEYSERDQRIRVVHKRNGGLVSARKAGIMLASGEYTAYVDSDDWIEREAYEKLVKILELYHPDMIAFGFKKEYLNFSVERKELLNEGFYNKKDFVDEAKHHIANCHFYCPIVHASVCCKIFKTNLLKVHQMNVNTEIHIGEDMAVTFPYILSIKNLYIKKECIYHYRVRKTSTMWSKEKDEFERYLKLVENLKTEKNILEEIQEGKEYLSQILYFYLIMCAPKYCFERDKCILFPELKRDDNILIYGKGVFATNLISCMRENKFSNIIGCIDRSDCSSIKEISKNTYLYILIAITDYLAVKDTLKLLESLGIEKKKILYIKKENLLIENLPKEVRYALES